MKTTHTKFSAKREPGIASPNVQCPMTTDQLPMTARSAFTLVELLIVVALLGALASIMLPQFRVGKKDANEALITSEMAEIQRAFIRFYNDCSNCTGHVDRVDWANVYLAPLITQTDTEASTPLFSYEPWDLDRNRGWRGPYAVSEGEYTNADDDDYPALLDPNGNPYQVSAIVTNSMTNLWLCIDEATVGASHTNRLKRQLTFDGI